jgi:hypothetical protein
MNKIFGKRLNKLYNDNKLENVLNIYKDKINEKMFIGKGDDASCFKTNDNKIIMKLCTKEIKYFKNNKDNSATTFMKLSKKMKNIIMPIKKILYEDEFVFIYTQHIISRFNKENITKSNLIDIYKIVLKLLSTKFYASVTAHNLCIYKNHIYIFDYHDIRPISNPINKINFSKTMLKYLLNYTGLIYAPQKTEKYIKRLDDLDYLIKKIIKDNLIPIKFIILLEYINIHQRLSKSILINIINNLILIF